MHKKSLTQDTSTNQKVTTFSIDQTSGALRERGTVTTGSTPLDPTVVQVLQDSR